ARRASTRSCVGTLLPDPPRSRATRARSAAGQCARSRRFGAGLGAGARPRMTTKRPKAKHKSAAMPIGLGFRALRGGGVVVGVALDKRDPRIVLSSFVATATADDRLAFEPYHVAAEMKRGP